MPLYKIRFGSHAHGGGAYILVGSARDAIDRMDELVELGLEKVELRDLDDRLVELDELRAATSE